MVTRPSSGAVEVPVWRRGRTPCAVGLVGLMLLSALAVGFTAGTVQPQSPVAVAGAAQENELTSCTVIDEPGRYVLVSDVRDADADACLDIRASDVVVDGNGHTVGGVDRSNSTGVSVAGTQATATDLANVTVRDITVTDWGTGVQAGVPMVAGPSVTLRDVTVRTSDSGIRLGEADGSVLDDVHVNGSGDGIYVAESSVEMRSVVVTGTDGYGVLFGQASSGSALTDARVTDNAGDGVVFGGPAEEVTVTNATISDNGGTGVTIQRDNSDVALRNSVVSNNTATGIVTLARTASGNDVRNTTVANNERDGVRVLGSGVSFHDVSFDGNQGYAYNATRNPDDDPLAFRDLHFRGHAISGEAPRLGLRSPAELQTLPEGTELAGLPVLVENLSSDATIDLSMGYGRFDNVDADESVGLWYDDLGDDEWTELADVQRDAAADRLNATVDRNGTFAPLDEGGDGDHPAASTFEVRSTAEDGQFAYRFTVDGAVEKTKLGPGKIAADVSDIVTRHDDGTVTVDGSTGERRGDAYRVWGEITSFEVVSGSEDYRLFLDGENVTGERPPGSGEDPPTEGRTFEIRSTNEDTEFSYRFAVDGSVEKTQLGDGGIAADASDTVSREDGTVVVDGSTGDGAGDAYTVDGEIQSFEIVDGPPDVELIHDGDEVTDEWISSDAPERRTLELRSTNEDTEFSYRITVDGQVRKAQLGDGGIAADASDEVSTEDDTTTVDGSTGDGAGDAYDVTGSIESIEITSGPPDVRILVDGEDVTDQYLDRSPARTFAIRATDEEGDIAYQFTVDGTARKAKLGDGGIAADADDEISTEDGTTTVDGSTGDGAGDAYRVRGEITSFERVSGAAGVRLLVDGEDVTDRLLPNESDGGLGEPSIEYVNCSAVRASGDYAGVRLGILLNENSGVDTGAYEPTREEFQEVTGGTGVYDVDGDWGSINGSIVSSARLVDAEGDTVAEASLPEGCAESIKPSFDLSVADVEQSGDGALAVTFAYSNDHDIEIGFDDQSLRGTVPPGEADELPDGLSPGNHSFTVQWTPESEDERLTWVLESASWAGLDDTVEVSTRPASAYDVTVDGESESADATETTSETDSPTPTASETTESPTETDAPTETATETETASPTPTITPTETGTPAPTPPAAETETPTEETADGSTETSDEATDAGG